MTVDVRVVLEQLRTQHLSRHKRRDVTACGLEMAVWLSHAAARTTRVLELGSGFSSTVLRWTAQRGAGVPEVWTVDHHPTYLMVTRTELELDGRSVDHLYTFGELLGINPVGQFDLIFVDLDGTALRLQHAADFLRWTAPGGVLMLDDWQMIHYAEPMQKLLEALDCEVTPVPETRDAHGRFGALVRRRPSAESERVP